MATELAVKDQAAIMEQVIMNGDLSVLTQEQRLAYVQNVCDSVGVNVLTKPFLFIKLNSKLTLYATRDCTDQLRNNHAVSITITDRSKFDDVYVVSARATDKMGRTDESTGAICLAGLRGEALANAMMKAETKAKRRVTLSICGLGMVDESEVDSIPGAERVNVNMSTGEIEEPASDLASPAQVKKAHAMASELWGKDVEPFKTLKKQLFGDARKSSELTKSEMSALIDALTVLQQQQAEAAEAEIVQDNDDADWLKQDDTV